MLSNTNQTQYRFSFHGNGGQLFGIYFLNVLLLILTLGLYWPWARANMLKFMYGNTEFGGNRFEFTGTGREMFKGFLKGLAILITLYAIYFAAILSGNRILLFGGLIVFVLGLAFLVPLAIHGALRYRLAKTTWRGIQFGYRGNLKELMLICVKGVLLTILTLGIYGAWFQVEMRQYIFKHIRWGSLSMRFEGKGGDLFVLMLVGYLLTVFTLGIYLFWFMRDIYRFYINHMYIDQGDKHSSFSTSISATDVFVLAMVSYFGILFTLGLATPWVICFATQKMMSTVTVSGDVDFDQIDQTEANFTDATGDDLADMLDIGII